MKTILILRGLPASGKSTFAKKLVKENPGLYKRLNRDDMREMLDGYRFSKSNEKFVKRMRDWLILESLRDGKHVIVDDTNLSSKNLNRITQLAEQYRKQTGEEVKVEVKEFAISLEDAIARDAQRQRSVGAERIRKLYHQFYGDGTRKGRGPFYAEQDKTLPPAIICDLDGTLAIIDHRNPFDASECEKDELNEPVADIVKSYHATGHQIILLSGRTDNYKAQTERWLAKHSIPYHQLLMRKDGDSRKDAIIKKEIVDANIKDQFYVKFVLVCWWYQTLRTRQQ